MFHSLTHCGFFLIIENVGGLNNWILWKKNSSNFRLPKVQFKLMQHDTILHKVHTYYYIFFVEWIWQLTSKATNQNHCTCEMCVSLSVTDEKWNCVMENKYMNFFLLENQVYLKDLKCCILFYSLDNLTLASFKR